MLGDMLRGDADETHPYVKALQFAIAALAAPPQARPIPQIVAEMVNFADVADRCTITAVANAPAAIRCWAERLAGIAPKADSGWPPCPECGAGALFACVACSATNYPPEQARPVEGVAVLARGWFHRRGPGDDYDIHDEASGAGEDCDNCIPCLIVPASPAPAPEVEPMFGAMIEADFEKGTITFEMRGDYTAAAGLYEIRPHNAIAVASPAMPDGFVLVPRAPTGEMLDAAINACAGFGGEDEVDAVWAAMLTAAQQEADHG
ncbi:hypothetical protein ACFQZQ_03165 [Lysobacter koreensis]|uniref:Uncharacterized protein n=1 Tax=Lysobacter koreensis TaxID=266122 RepID=A0ABW2YJ07_9GAMM